MGYHKVVKETVICIVARILMELGNEQISYSVDGLTSTNT